MGQIPMAAVMLLCLVQVQGRISIHGPFETKNRSGLGRFRSEKLRWLKLDHSEMILTTHTEDDAYYRHQFVNPTNTYDANNVSITLPRDNNGDIVYAKQPGPRKTGRPLRHCAYLNANGQKGGPNKTLYTRPRSGTSLLDLMLFCRELQNAKLDARMKRQALL